MGMQISGPPWVVSIAGGGVADKDQNRKGRQRWVVFGDSYSGYHHVHSGLCTSLVSNGDGTATITFSGALGVKVGDLIGVAGANDPGFHVLETPILVEAGSGPVSYTYALAGQPAIATGVSDGVAASLVYRFRKFGGGYSAVTQALLRQDVEFYNAGIGGDTFAKALARFDRDVLAQRPNGIVIRLGRNDVFAAGLTLAQIQTSAVPLFDKARNTGLPVIILPDPPQDSAAGFWSTAKRDVYASLWRWLAQMAKAYDFAFVDSWRFATGSTSIVNATDANLNPNSGMLWDQVHYSYKGTYIDAKGLAAHMRPMIPSQPRLTSSVADGNMMSGGLMQGTGGTAGTGASTMAAWAGTTIYTAGQAVLTSGRLYVCTAGGTSSGAAPTHTSGTAVDGTVTWLYVRSGVTAGVATGWTASQIAGTGTVSCGTAARTIVDDGDLVGNNQVLALNFAAAGDQIRFGHSSIHAQLTNGDKARVAVVVKITAGSDKLQGLQLFVNSQTSISINKQFYDCAYASSVANALPAGETPTFTFEVEADVRTPASVHGTITDFSIRVEAVGAAAGGAVIEVGCASAFKLA